jgi:hypothetical protein
MWRLQARSVAEEDRLHVIRVKEPMQPRGWHEDKTKRVQFPPGTPMDEMIGRLIAMIQERAHGSSGTAK